MTTLRKILQTAEDEQAMATHAQIQDLIKKVEKAKEQLNEILNSELMKQAEKFVPRIRDRWEGQLSVIMEVLK